MQKTRPGYKECAPGVFTVKCCDDCKHGQSCTQSQSFHVCDDFEIRELSFLEFDSMYDIMTTQLELINEQLEALKSNLHIEEYHGVDKCEDCHWGINCFIRKHIGANWCNYFRSKDEPY